ncbi:domain of Kin17 curved DNA-binding protein-domain-containing protein [Kalaharituber pfeilii]|nr:domain of Kin17 curved DNA-binding protein-domain-containing protein [Kalaharituber pfeilii]
MPRAEVGTNKYLSNRMKAKGLQRLRWYCQVCEKQCRDENGFKCHTQSESHVRQMLVVGENAKAHVDNYSNQFKSDFLSLLRTSHGEKKINANHFYQEYISNKQHIHMNATRWVSLTEFVKYLGREGLCRVEEGEKGLFISWIDNSPEALARKEAIRKKERMDRGDEEREQKAIQEQIERARREAEISGRLGPELSEDQKVLQRGSEAEKIKLSLGVKTNSTFTLDAAASPEAEPKDAKKEILVNPPTKKSKNVFAAMAKKKSGEVKKDIGSVALSRPMSEAERIMKEELERKRIKNGSDNSSKRQRFV